MAEQPTPQVLIDAMPDGMYVVDTERRITLWNRSAARISGFPEEEVLGRWCGDGLLNHVDETGRAMCDVRCPLAGTMRDGRPRTCRMFLHHRDGRLIPVRITASPLRDADGRITGALETFSEDGLYFAAQAQLREAESLALRDPLTGLGNRRSLELCLDRRLEGFRRTGRRFGVLVLDLDHFKLVNDTYGHMVGDEVLQEVARALRHAVRPHDDVIRHGGEEFVILAGPVTPAQLAALAQRVMQGVRRGRYATAPQHLQTLSIGSALVRAEDTAVSLIHRADQRLLAAKVTGRDRAVSVDAVV
ncbi:diguanylate cyclase [Actinotalea ferrariae CF5-4]|uniref:Diguanylate cyclase n=1 Tax=Actinotalea ferrariae CF5-4 TaxID=948458 RepID=A0A021VQM0_9CELL|nr:sensor domain-containing diguanylate cyclase [Actinotalea ferrariae]EYR63499.1 diguanylate cyclase [Actinotalea ferrariae CF5-4]